MSCFDSNLERTVISTTFLPVLGTTVETALGRSKVLFIDIFKFFIGDCNVSLRKSLAKMHNGPALEAICCAMSVFVTLESVRTHVGFTYSAVYLTPLFRDTQPFLIVLLIKVRFAYQPIYL